MGRAKEGAPLHALVRMAIPLCQRAEQVITRVRRGAKPMFKDWQLAVLIMVVVLKKKKTKSSQYRYLVEHRRELSKWLELARFPVRSTYFQRYRRIFPVFELAMKLHTTQAQRAGLLQPRHVSTDKSLIPARGPAWSVAKQRRGERPAGVDIEASWGYSRHHRWQFGFGYESVVCRMKSGAIWPLLASLDTASVKESQTFLKKIPHLPLATHTIAADKGYDSNAVGEAVEWDSQGRRTGRRFLCPQIYRRGKHRRGRGPRVERGLRAIHRQRREARHRFLDSQLGRRYYQQRSQTVEPFHQWFKQRFELTDRCWHRGLDNNRTQVLAAMFAYQLLLRYNHHHRKPNAQLAWILDGL